MSEIQITRNPLPLITYGVEARNKGAKPTIPWVDVGATYRSEAPARATMSVLAGLHPNREFRVYRLTSSEPLREILD